MMTSVAAQSGQRDGALLDVRDLEVQFATDEGWITVVDNVSFSVAPGEILGIVGESGAGKTVTALSVLKLIPEKIGRIRRGSLKFQGEDLLAMSERQINRIRGNRIAMIFQEPMTSLNPAYTVGDQISEVVRLHERVRGRIAWQRAVSLLDRVGIPSAQRRAHDYPHTFSGGMRQRAMIAMAIACNPILLIADEPTTALDVTVQATILELLRELQDEYHMAIMYVTHDLGVVSDLCERVIVMYAGQIVEQAAAGELFERPRHPYTEGLLRSMPHAAVEGQPLWSIPGAVPPAGKWPVGCRFHPRCRYIDQPRCTTGPVELVSLGGRSARCVRVDELDLSVKP
jgi:peptide/nickel transport system ATP-binding protein